METIYITDFSLVIVLLILNNSGNKDFFYENSRFFSITRFFFFSFLHLDKIFTIDYFKNNFMQTGNIVYYKHRPLLFEKN